MNNPAKNDAASNSSDREMIIRRVFDAPRDLVWKVWTDPQHLTHWWGPNGFTTTTHEWNLKPGGIWSFIMHGPDGRDYVNKIRFLEISPPDHLSYKHTGDDAAVEEISFHTTVTFTVQGNKTEVTLRSIFATPGQRDFVVKEYGAIEGGEQTLERFGQQLVKVMKQAKG